MPAAPAHCFTVWVSSWSTNPKGLAPFDQLPGVWGGARVCLCVCVDDGTPGHESGGGSYRSSLEVMHSLEPCSSADVIRNSDTSKIFKPLGFLSPA